MRSLRAKILLMVICVVVVAQAFTVVAILYNAKDKSRSEAFSNLRSAVSIVSRYMEERATGMKQLSLTLVDNDEFRAIIGTDDPALIMNELNYQQERIIADILLLTDSDGTVLYTTYDELQPGSVIAELPLISGESFTAVLNQQGYEMVASKVPIGGSDIYLVIGIVIGDQYASQIAGVTGLQASFATDSATGRLFLGSSLEPLDRALMIAGIEDMRSGGQVTKALDEVRSRFVSTRTPFVTKKGHIYLLMHQSLDIAMAPYKQLQVFMSHLFATTLLLVGVVIWIFSTVVTRPLHQLSDAVKRMTVGDYTKKVEVRTRDEIGSLAEVFNAMQDGIEQREQEIVQQSLTDPTTGLPNRQHAIALLNERIGHGYEVAVFLLDLGRFQHLRSTVGHKVADEMLRLSTARMKRNLDSNAALARLEGDEFLLVMPVSGIDAAINEAETMYALLESGISVRKARVSLEVHIGIALYPEHGDSADDLLRNASLAKQEAIRARTPVKVYQEGKGEQHSRRLRILSDLRSAIDENHFELHMQPKISMASGDLVGAEALVRWQHPELGEIMPGEFIPLIEEAGSISQLTRWVLEEAIHHCATWQQQGVDMPVSVNLSAQDLKNESLADQIDKLLLDYGLTSKSLVLEITEEALVRNMKATINVLNTLRSRGFRISMDDFGTGYSSLHQLKHLPIDELKIDRAFVRDLPGDTADVAIVRATIQLATTMGLDVVAEGVESEEAWHFLVREGCKEAQGYLVSKPMEASHFVNWKKRYVQARYNPIDKGMQLLAPEGNKFAG